MSDTSTYVAPKPKMFPNTGAAIGLAAAAAVVGLILGSVVTMLGAFVLFYGPSHMGPNRCEGPSQGYGYKSDRSSRQNSYNPKCGHGLGQDWSDGNVPPPMMGGQGRLGQGPGQSGQADPGLPELKKLMEQFGSQAQKPNTTTPSTPTPAPSASPDLSQLLDKLQQAFPSKAPTTP